MNQSINGLIVFVFSGILVLILDTLVDSFYFWINNFRTNLKKIVVENEKNNITYESLK
jgi:hypothetical protein